MGESVGELCNMILLDTNMEDPLVVADHSLICNNTDLEETGTSGTRGRGGPVSNDVVTDMCAKVMAILITHDTSWATVNGHPDHEKDEVTSKKEWTEVCKVTSV